MLYQLQQPQAADTLSDHLETPCMWLASAPAIICTDGGNAAYMLLHEKILALLLNYLHDFPKFQAKNSATLFSGKSLEMAIAEYHPKEERGTSITYICFFVSTICTKSFLAQK